MSLHKKHLCLLLGLSATPALALAQSLADAFPSKPVTLIQAATPGGSADIVMRLYAKKITENTKWNMLLDYKPGAGGVIGFNQVAKAIPDGHTILMINSPFTTTAATVRNLPYDPVADFAPVYMTSKATSVLFVHPSLPINSVKDYVAYAKANPGKINYGTSGTGSISHLSAVWLNQLAGINVTFIPFKGTTEARVAILSGEIQATNGTLLGAIQDVKAGKVRPIGTLDASQRSPLLPDVPTIAEQGYPSYSHLSWAGVTAPAKVPGAIIAKLNAEYIKAAFAPEVVETLAKGGEENGGRMTPEQFKERTTNEINRWRKVVRDAGLTVQDL